MNKQQIFRPTAMGMALAAAAGRVDHHWVGRRVEHNIQHTKIGVKAEPAVNAHLSLKTYKALVATGVME